MSKWTCTELIQQSVEYFDANDVAGVTGRIGIVLTGPGGGTWTYVITEGQLEVLTGLVPPLDGSMQVAAEDWLRLHTGELSGAEAFRQSRIQMQGDVALLRVMGGMFHHQR